MHTINKFTNRILNGDCIEILKQMPNESIDLIVTDPPYLVNYTDRSGRKIANDNTGQWLFPAFEQIFRVLKNHTFCISFYGWNNAEQFLTAWKSAGFVPVGHFVFVKRYASRTGYARAHHEQAYLLAKGNPAKPENPPADVFCNWRYTGNRLHPTQKPVEIILPLIEAYSRPNGIVLDPFAGSGTTVVAARKCHRQGIGIELNTRFCQVANYRLLQTYT
jgi:site-specific DNA-methyltransferase (adenine-specific)